MASSRRVEALRAALRSFASQLLNLSQSICLRDLSEGGEVNLLARLEEAARSLAQLVAGGLRRIRADEHDEPAQCGAAIRLIDFGVERALRGSKAPLIEAKYAFCSSLPKNQ